MVKYYVNWFLFNSNSMYLYFVLFYYFEATVTFYFHRYAVRYQKIITEHSNYILDPVFFVCNFYLWLKMDCHEILPVDNITFVKYRTNVQWSWNNVLCFLNSFLTETNRSLLWKIITL